MKQLLQNNFKSFYNASISNMLVVLMLAGTLAFYLGLDKNFALYTMGGPIPNSIIEFIRLFTFQFLHGGFMHFFSNAIFILLFGNMIEKSIGKEKYILFFLLSIPVTGILLLYFSRSAVMGMSGFAMAILAYYILDAYHAKNPEYQAGILLLIINLVVGFSAEISFLGHLFGALYGALFYILFHNKK